MLSYPGDSMSPYIEMSVKLAQKYAGPAVRLANAEWNASGNRGVRYMLSSMTTLEGEPLVVDACNPDGCMYVSDLIGLLSTESQKWLGSL